MKQQTRLFIIGILMVSVFTSGIFLVKPQKTEAGISECVGAIGAGSLGSTVSAAFAVLTSQPITEGSTAAALAKECLLDSIGIALREALIRKITSATVEWINSGFEGSPAFVTNIEDFLLDTADEAFGSFIYDNTNFAFLCSNLQFDIRFAIALSYAQRNERPTCTLSNIVDNVETAIDDLSVTWDWDVYQTIATDPSANPFLGLIQVSEDVENLLAAEQQKQLDDLNRGGGFLSFQHCRPKGSTTNTYENNGNSISVEGSTLSSASFDRTDRSDQECEVATPGSIIRQGLSDNLGSDLDRLGMADEFDEIIGALMGQLFKQVFSGEGLTGVSKRSGNSRNFLAEYQQDTTNAAQDETEDLGESIQSYRLNAESYIETEEERIARLTDARIQAESAFVCYETKYNTWLNKSGTIIEPDQVESVPETDRSRATFAYLTDEAPVGAIFGGNFLDQIRILLTPQVSLQKVEEFGSILAKIDGDIQQATQGIEDAQRVVKRSEEYSTDFANTTDPAENLRIFQEFSRDIPGINVDNGAVQASLQSTISFAEDVILGRITFVDGRQTRQGGAVSELQQCQLFNQIYTGG